MKKFYITTAIPYVNAAPHIGHALEFVQADVISRYHHDILGEETCLLSGADENALKNVQAAEKAGIPVQDFVDLNAKLFQELALKLNVNFNIFQKGSSEQHYFSSQELWKRCFKNGDIYKESYKGLYCVGCEQFYEPEELNGKGECFEHPGKKLDAVEEENWFFRLKKYEKDLIDIINGVHEQYPLLEIEPVKRKHEILSFLTLGLKDISISRSNKRAKNWGVPVPNDATQRMYVWFDALNIYQSGVGFNWNLNMYNKWWPANVHVIGKGISRFHAVYWPAFLLSAKLDLPKKIFIHEYITINGQKMSKTLGNVIDPFELIKKYHTDPLRYYFLREIPPFSDGDFSERRFKELYNADLANNLGNLVSRVSKLILNNKLDIKRLLTNHPNKPIDTFQLQLKVYLDSFQFDRALEHIWKAITGLNQYIDKERIWEQTGSESLRSLGNIIVGTEAITSIREIGESLKPFLPDTAEKILRQFAGSEIKSITPLFPRIT